MAALVLTSLVAACGGAASSDSAKVPARPSTTAAPTTSAPATTLPASAVEVSTHHFEDPSRQTLHPGAEPTAGRSLPTRIWAAPASRPRPLIVVAHGLTGEPEEFDGLATAWARAGYVVAAPRFPGSSGPKGKVPDFVNQPGDVRFVIDQVAKVPALKADTDRVGVAGLSLGGSTVYGLTTDTCCRDPRIRAGAIFDGLLPGAFRAVVPNAVPVLAMHCRDDPVLPYAANALGGFGRMAAPAWLVTMPCREHSQPYTDEASAFDPLVEQLTLSLWAGTLAEPPALLTSIPAAVKADGRATVQTKG